MENWKEINFRGFSWNVSDMGNVRFRDGSKNRVLFKNSSGYLSFSKGNIRILVHRMIAIAFIPNPQNKKFVNHKDGNKQNNKIDNLEWVTKIENELHSTRVLGNKRNTSGLVDNRIKVDICDLKGVIITTSKSISIASKNLKVGVSVLYLALKKNGIVKGKNIVKYHNGS